MPVLSSFYNYFWNLRAHNGELPRVHKRPPNSPPNGAPNGSGKANHFGAVSGPPRDSKTPLRTARNQLGATSGPLFWDHFRPTPRQQNTAQDHSKPARSHFGTTSEPPRSLLIAKHRSGPLRASRPQNTAANRSKPARDQLRPH